MARRVSVPVVDIPDSEAIRALSPQHRAFVEAYAGGASLGDALRAAGFGDNTARSGMASRWLRRSDVGAALQEIGRSMLRGEGARSIATMIALRDDTRVVPAVRLKAAQAIADRSGFHPVTEAHEHVHHHLSEQEMDRRILSLCAELGMDAETAQRMLIAPSNFTQNPETGVFELEPEPVEIAADHTEQNPADDQGPDHHWGRVPRPNPSRVAQKMREYRARLKAMSPEEREQRQQMRKTARDLGIRQPRATSPIDNELTR